MRRDTILAFFVIVAMLGALAGKSLLLSVPPVKHGAGQFDADRAKARLAFILGDQRPHPADSPADDAVRTRLVTSLEEMGLHPVVRDQMACNAFERSRLLACARVRNVVASLGPRTGKALLLSAHYDSVPVGPGASDDGIGVATLLEVASILRNAPLKRPVLLLFNEGEELGLVGARAFLADPLSQNVDSVLNFEARGVNGPVTMFETNKPNGGAIRAYGTVVPHRYASSLSTDVARLIPNDTDVTTFKERHWLTLNSAIVGNETRYHSPGDDLSGLDVRSLQDMGDEALALTMRLSSGIPEARGDRLFFDVAQHAFVELSLATGVIWLVFLLLAFAFLAVRYGQLLPAASLVFAALVTGGGLGWLALTLVGMLRAGTYWRAHPEFTFIAIYCSVLVGELALFCSLGSKIDTKALRRGYWVVFLLLGGLLALRTPGAIIYFLMPPAVVLLGIILSRWYARCEPIGALLGLLLLFLTWGELLAGLEELFSPGPLFVVVPAAAIMISAVLVEAGSLVSRANRQLLVLAAAALALVLWTIAATTPAYSQDHQQRFTIEHVTEFPSGRSSWSILSDGAPLPTGYATLGRWHRGKFDFSARQRWLAPAPSDQSIRAATVLPREVKNDANERTISLRIAANGAERILIVAPSHAHIRSAGFAAFRRSIEDGTSPGKLIITCTGRSCEGADLTMIMRSEDPLELTIVGSRNGLPPSAAPLLETRPRFARPQYVPDEIVTVTHVRV